MERGFVSAPWNQSRGILQKVFSEEDSTRNYWEKNRRVDRPKMIPAVLPTPLKNHPYSTEINDILPKSTQLHRNHYAPANRPHFNTIYV